MVDHMNALLRPKRDQQFSHSLSEKRTFKSEQVQLINLGCQLRHR